MYIWQRVSFSAHDRLRWIPNWNVTCIFSPTFRKSSDPLIIDFIFSNNNQNNVYLTETIGFIPIKTNILLPRAYVTLSCLSSLVYLLSKLLTIIWLSNRSTWSVPDEGYWAYLMKVIECTWWRLLSVPDEGYWAYLMKVILSVPDEGYWAYLMKVIERTW